jgi:chemotaxis protein histidine kinase CheA/CheY-like chemotaxis protein
MNPDLFDRFRAGSLERIRTARGAIADLEEGRCDVALLKRVVGDLHTLKGESRMLGLAAMSKLAHAVEDCLAPAVSGKGAVSGEVLLAARDALDTIARSLRGELGDEPANSDELGAALDDLSAVLAAQPESDGGVPEPAVQMAEVPAPAGPLDRWAQIKTSDVDQLCERMYEFAATFGQLETQVRALMGAAPANLLRPALEEFERCRTQLEELDSAALALRLVAVEPSLARLGDHIRDLAASQGKRVRVVLDGAGAELERAILDELWDPLLHLVRNAVDHGVEPPDERGDKPVVATVRLSAHSEGPNVVVSIVDDGRGIDWQEVRKAAVLRGVLTQAAAAAISNAEASELLFQHGFSTRRSVTEVSGRGVGLDVVERKVEALGGAIGLVSELGKGTTFTLRVPATITKERILLFSMGNAIFGLPSRSVLSVATIEAASVREVAGGRSLHYMGEWLALQSLAVTLGFPAPEEERHALVLDLFGHRRAYSFSGVLGEQELVRRPVDAAVRSVGTVAASATMDDGRLVLLVRLEALAGRAVVRARPRAAPVERRQRRVLVVDDSPIVRELVADMLHGVGLEVAMAEDGAAALRAMESRAPDLVLSDVEMPGMDGLELLRRIRTKNQVLPIVMLTTRGSAADKKAAAELGANAYLVKSEFEGSKLIDAVSRFINLEA